MTSHNFKVDFIGIGASKSGTTWLGHMLEVHPQLCMSVPKEVHFFNDRLTYRSTVLGRNYPKGIDWYRNHFRHCKEGTKKGEITPRYSTDALVPLRIKEHNPTVKLLYCLRHPVDRIESHYNFAKYFVGKEDRPMEQAIREEPEFLDMTMYFKNLSMFLEHFPREQIMVIWFEDIQKNPDQLLRDVYTFLDVDPAFRPVAMNEKSNQGRVSKWPWLQIVIRKMNYQLIQLGLSGFVKTLKSAGLGKWVMQINSKPLQKERIPPGLKDYILDQVREDILRLQQWSGRDLSHWLR